MELTQDELKRQLYYDPLTGYFKRIVSNSNRVKIGDIAGCKNNTDGYIYITINNKRYSAHRLVWLYENGYFPENQIDHINRVRDDNKIINLREASQQCNSRNSSTRTNNTSGIVGVSWSKNAKKWHTQIAIENKRIHLGYFKSKTDAAKARWDAEVQYGFPNCNTTSTAYQYIKGKGTI